MTMLLLALLLFVISLLAVVPPPAAWLWLLSVPVKEWGHLLVILCLPFLWPGWVHGWPGALGSVLAGAAAVLFLMPLLRAIPVARRLPADLEAAFGPCRPVPGTGRRPLRAGALLLGLPSPRLATETVVYADHGDGRPLKMAITRPAAGDGPAPVVLVIHGGSWRSGDHTQLAGLNRYLAARGYLVAAIDYRLAPGASFPAPLADVKAAITYIKERAAGLGADPERFVLLGRSAGGQLAVVAAYSAHDPAIRGVISFYGPFDLAWGWDEPGWILPSREILGQYLGGSPEAVPHAYRDASPLTLVVPGLPPTLMIQGAADCLVSPLHNVKLSALLRDAGVPHTIVSVPLATHGSDVNLGGPFGQISTYAVEHFLERVLG
ncbi:MAG: alpha/beta hydrolase [Firmicutes bacterium]|nr:alpha/beta hydrolase [Bacillota bacterium]